MFYICEHCIFIPFIYATISLTECMFIYVGFMMQPTNYPAFLSVGMFPKIIMLTFRNILLFLYREYVFSLRFSSFSDPKTIVAINVNSLGFYLAAVLMCHLTCH